MDASSTAHQRVEGSTGPTGSPDPAGPTGLTGLGLDELRTLRRDTEEQEADLSYLRRLLHGRMDILRAELDRRQGGRRAPLDRESDGSADPSEGGSETEGVALLDRLPAILADAPSSVRRPARHLTFGPPRGAQYQREADELMGDVQLADLDATPTPALLAAIERLAGYEQEVSRRRQVLQRTADDCSAEITRRYREGEARVDDLLTGG